ncbi:MAG: hypothetical protein BGO49_22110 [Planctomycetales bacterium 71-10]|nr:MAG: hypothetical protein BGO49_22110 [Planctomycetales bacterium 71-10]
MAYGVWMLAAALAGAEIGGPRTVGGPAPPPVEGGGPVAVGVGFHFIDVGRVTAREENFDVTAHLKLRWRDPRLARGAAVDGKVWRPWVNFDNAADAPRLHGDPSIEVDDDGWVTLRMILSGKFSTPLDLRRFPFDSQDLVVRISLAEDESRVRFEPLPDSMAMHDDVFITDWSIEKQGYEVKARRYHPRGQVYSYLEYMVRVKRRPTFYAWRVLLPLTLLPLIPALVFRFEPTNLQPQISTCIGTLIAMLTFGYSVDFALPKVAYLTLIDRHAMIGFVFATAATIAVTMIHRAVVDRTLADALRIQSRIAAIYPAAYVLAAAANFALLAAGPGSASLGGLQHRPVVGALGGDPPARLAGVAIGPREGEDGGGEDHRQADGQGRHAPLAPAQGD